MTRAQIEAARKRVDGVLDEHVGALLTQISPASRDRLAGALVTAVLGHPDGRAPRAKPSRRWPTRAQR